VITVEHEPPDLAELHIQERCCFCREFTRYWVVNMDVACCQRCARYADPTDVPSKEVWCRRERIATAEDRPSGCTGPAVPKPPLGKLLPWCMKCQQRPCIGEGCAERYRLLTRFGVLHAYADRSDIEEREVHALQAQLAAVGVDTGWEIVPRRKK
jgi:hypothetical protein